MPKKKTYRDAGFISRPHGLKGELKLKLGSPFSFQDILEKNFLMIDLRGEVVPHYVEAFSAHKDEIIVRLGGIENVEAASRLIGARVVADEQLWKDEPGQLKGFLLIDKHAGLLGMVEDVVEMPGQNMLKFSYEGREALIPFVEAFILEIKPRKKEIHLELPEGLLDLN